MKRTIRLAVAAGAAGLLMLATPVAATPAGADDALVFRDQVTFKVDAALLALGATTAKITVSLRLADPSLAEAVGADAKQAGSKLTGAAQRNHVNTLKNKQRALMGKVAGLGGREVATVQKSVNALIVSVDANKINELAAMPEVTSVKPVYDRELDLSETVPYIGGTALHNRTPGITGKGVRVAVLDSGIDYTHARFGGAGTAAAYAAAYGTTTDDPKTTTTDGLFPTAKVLGGFDFVGETWPITAALTEDPDPIDCGTSIITAPAGEPPCAGGHGSHVASIIAGNNGVAPDAKLYAYKVCSARATSCSGVALLKAMERSLDPNNDGDISDAVDIINMSLGSNYGQREDDLSAASAHAVRMGVLVITSAGNAADKPYIVGSPSTTPEVLSVAQTNVPSALAYVLRINSPANIAGVYKNTSTVDWANITTGFSGDVKYGTANLGERQGCADAAGTNPYPAGFFAGKIALIDRGTCAISMKVHNAAISGAVGVIVANNAPGAAPSFSFGGPGNFQPAQTLIVGIEHGDTIKSGLASGVNVAVSPADAVALKGSMVATSSRGPSHSFQAIKPEIGAPGGSLSVEAGTGTGETAFGGTSGAAPMVSGAAALVLQAYPKRNPLEVKSVLMNTGETNIMINPLLLPGRLAEITRIGGGEVRADKAVDSRTAAWDAKAFSAGLSFGNQALSRDRTLFKIIHVRNYSNQWRIYTITPTFRYADDQASGAVKVNTLSKIIVPPRATIPVPVTLTIRADKLSDWGDLNGGANGASGELLANVEFDGYLNISGGGDNIHLPWHVLAHRAADVTPAKDKVKLSGGAGSLSLSNPTRSGQAGISEVFALTGTSPRIPSSELPGAGDNRAVIDLRAVGVRQVEIPGAGPSVQFGFTTFGQRSHPNAPGEFHVLIDKNRDGTPDFEVFNADLTIYTTGAFDGRNAVYIVDLATNALVARALLVDADLNSANVAFGVPLSLLGMSPGQQFDYSAFAVDGYFSGAVTDSIEGMTFTLGTPKFAASTATVTVPAGGSASLGITAVAGGATASPSQSGFLLLHRDAQVNQEASLITVS